MDFKYVYGNTGIEFKEEGDAAFFQKWWRFQYANRHLYRLRATNKKFRDEFEKAVETVVCIYDIAQGRAKCAAGIFPINTLDFCQFANALVYSYHRAECRGDGYYDFRYELDTYRYDFSLNSLSSDEFEAVKLLHDWTVKLGFLSIQLFQKPDLTLSRDAFILKTISEASIKRDSIIFPYYTEKYAAPGLMIITGHSEDHVAMDWDLAVFYHDGDVLDEIKKKMPGAEDWKKPGKREIGEPTDASIRVYVKRDLCSKTKALRFLKAQIAYREKYRQSRFYQQKKSMPKKQKRALDYVATVSREADGLTQYSREFGSNNLRRAMALINWDMQNIHRQNEMSQRSRCKDIFESYIQSNKKLPEHYLSKFNSKLKTSGNSATGDDDEPPKIDLNYGDVPKYYDHVITEMERDCAVAQLCIEHAGYFTYSDVKKVRRHKAK